MLVALSCSGWLIPIMNQAIVTSEKIVHNFVHRMWNGAAASNEWTTPCFCLQRGFGVFSTCEQNQIEKNNGQKSCSCRSSVTWVRQLFCLLPIWSETYRNIRELSILWATSDHTHMNRYIHTYIYLFIIYIQTCMLWRHPKYLQGPCVFVKCGESSVLPPGFPGPWICGWTCSLEVGEKNDELMRVQAWQCVMQHKQWSGLHAQPSGLGLQGYRSCEKEWIWTQSGFASRTFRTRFCFLSLAGCSEVWCYLEQTLGF